MTTSNHRPYTYPEGRIDIPSGSGRNGAVKFTDRAIGDFLSKIRNKPWFSNTVIIFIADHCASSAGKNEIDISKYHIPALIYDARGHRHFTINKLCSQIDLYPTLFSLLHWDYRSDLFGKNVLANNYQPRAFVGTYQKLGYLENDSLVILSPQRKVETYLYRKDSNQQEPILASERFVHKAIANYQTAYFLFKHKGLKL
jgi:phosphoglycerol transferase MdoB-like AlkP superfamily enzyme